MTGIKDVREGVSDYREKPCSKCRMVSPLSNFSAAPHHSDGRSSWCRPCIRVRSRSRYASGVRSYHTPTPEQRERKLVRRREREYGHTAEMTARLMERQDGLCAICRTTTIKGSLHLDHCHSTGRVRGFLCSKCNTSLGALEGWYAEWREAVDNYLKEYA